MSTLPYQMIKARCLNNDGESLDDAMIIPCVERTTHNGFTYGLSCAGYDLRIAEDITLYPRNVRNWFYNLFQRNKAKKRKSYALASTIEYFNIPNDIKFEIKDKSTWARFFSTVQNTFAEPGWKGYLTLELTNHSDEIVIIRKGNAIAQAIFEFLAEATEMPYSGKYQFQKAGPQPAILQLEFYPEENDKSKEQENMKQQIEDDIKKIIKNQYT